MKLRHAVLAALLSTSAFAQAPQAAPQTAKGKPATAGKAAKPPAKPKPPQGNVAAESPKQGGAQAPGAVDQLHLANELADWGRQNKNAAALALASRIRSGVTTAPRTDTEKMTEAGSAGGAAAGGADGGSAAQEKQPRQVTAETLLTEARALATDPAGKELVESINRSPMASAGGTRGSTPGASCQEELVRSNATDVYRVEFTGREVGEVLISGDGDSDLDLYIHDDAGNLVTKGDGLTDDEFVRWMPLRTGQFAIRVKNRGVANRYTFCTN
jgi:hypothetical protein